MLRLKFLPLLSSLALGFSVSVATMVAPGGASESNSVRIAIEGAFPPFNYLDSSNQLQGFDVDIARALCKAANLSCELVVQEWTGMIPNLLAEDYDAIISSMSMSAARREQVAFTTRYYDSPSVFVVRKGSEIAGIAPADLKNARLGVTSATSQEAYIKATYPDITATIFESSPDLYKGLVDGSVDVIIEDKLAIYDWLANTKAGSCCEFRGGDIKDPQYFGEGAGVAVRRADKELLARFNTALREIQTTGAYDAINAKYFPFGIR